MALLPKDPAQQKRLLIGIIPLLLAFVYYQFVHTKKAVEIADLETHYENLERTNATAKILAEQGGPELERRLAMYEQHMKRLEELIPKREQVPELLNDMGRRAQLSSVEVTLMRPEGEEASPYYSRQSYEFGVKGTYHNVGRFLSEVGSLPRIVTPTEFRLMGTTLKDKQGAPLLNANFRIITYIVPDATASADSAVTNGSN
jgi:type IV pilus assembly protein PilO